MDSVSLMTMGKITEKSGQGIGSGGETIASIINGETVSINLPIQEAIEAIMGEADKLGGKVENENGIYGEVNE